MGKLPSLLLLGRHAGRSLRLRRRWDAPSLGDHLLRRLGHGAASATAARSRTTGGAAALSPLGATPAIKEITTHDLRPADVLLLSPYPGSRAAQGQVILCNAPVSHSAMVHADPAYLVESIHWDSDRSEVSVSRAEERFRGREVTVKRLNSAGPGEDLGGVLKVAESYVGEPYARASEYLQGLYLGYARLASYRWCGAAQEHSDVEGWRGRVESVRCLTARLMESANRRYYPGRRPVLCAEFVYRCYREAGLELRLDVKRGPRGRDGAEMQPTGVPGVPAIVAGGGGRSPNPANGVSPLNRLLAEIEDVTGETDLFITGLSTEERVMELVRMLGGDEIRADVPGVDTLEADIISAICRVVNDPEGEDASLGVEGETAASSNGNGNDTIDEAFFVTPADLYGNCSNLSYVGTIPFSG